MLSENCTNMVQRVTLERENGVKAQRAKQYNGAEAVFMRQGALLQFHTDLAPRYARCRDFHQFCGALHASLLRTHAEKCVLCG